MILFIYRDEVDNRSHRISGPPKSSSAGRATFRSHGAPHLSRRVHAGPEIRQTRELLAPRSRERYRSRGTDSEVSGPRPSLASARLMLASAPLLRSQVRSSSASLTSPTGQERRLPTFVCLVTYMLGRRQQTRSPSSLKSHASSSSNRHQPTKHASVPEVPTSGGARPVGEPAPAGPVPLPASGSSRSSLPSHRLRQ